MSLVVTRVDLSSILAMHEPLNLPWASGPVETPTLETYNTVELTP